MREQLEDAAKTAKAWFEESTHPKSRPDFDSHGRLGDRGNGSVYVYLDPSGIALYVGQTGGSVKARTNFQTAKHRSADWWSKWSTLRFLPLEDKMDRLTLEFLLILAYQPLANKKPAAKAIGELFANLSKRTAEQV